MTQAEIMVLYEEATSEYEKLMAMKIIDIENGSNPEYKTADEYMRDLGYWEGRRDAYAEMKE